MVVETKVMFVDGGLSIMQILHGPSSNSNQSADDKLKKDSQLTLPRGTRKSAPENHVVPPAEAVAKTKGDKGGGIYGSTDPGGGVYGSTDPGFRGVTIIFGNVTTGCRCSESSGAAQTNKSTKSETSSSEKVSAQGPSSASEKTTGKEAAK